MANSLITPIISVATGVGLGTASLMGFISTQTDGPSKSPANAEAPTFDYGVTDSSE